jgi:type IV pilus assembly protein PilA
MGRGPVYRFRAAAATGFTLVELMVVVTIIGVLAAVAVPSYLKASRKAKTAEATSNVKRIYDGARSYYEEERSQRAAIAPIARQFPNSAPAITPALGACCANAGHKCMSDPSLWVDETWTSLKFAVTDPHYYSYSYLSSGTETAAQFSATSYGDLDCDADYSTFELTGSVQADGTVTGQAGFFKDRELE